LTHTNFGQSDMYLTLKRHNYSGIRQPAIIFTGENA